LKALLLAAGLGTRLRPLTNTIPKCLVPIHQRPLLDYWLELLLDGPVESALVNTHHLAAGVRDFISASRWRNRVTLVHEPTLLGTAGTVLRNRDFFGREPFLVIHADNLSLFDVRAFIARHAARPHETVLTMMTFDTDAPTTCGIVVQDPNGVVLQMHEKVADPPGTRANAAIYILEPEVVDFIGTLGKSVLDLSTEVLPHFMGRIYSYHNARYHRDIGSLESLGKAEAEFAPRLK
jgi:mannose-1-phosphate guanylyltransferase